MRRAWLGLCALPWLALAGFGARGRGRNEWIQWRDAQIGRILTPTFDDHGEKVLSRDEVIARCAEAYSAMQPNMVDLGRPELRPAMGNFIRFVSAQARMAIPKNAVISPYALGMDISDRDYWNYVSPYVRFPDLLASPDFLRLMNSPAGYQEAVDLIQRQNQTLPESRRWLVKPLRTQFIKSVDKTTYGRLLVYVPNEPDIRGGVVDRWFFFAICAPDQPEVEEQSVSVIAVSRNPAKPGVSRVYASDFLRALNPISGVTKLVSNYLLDANPSKNCYDCHKTGVLPIHAKAAYKFDEGGALIEDPSGVKPLEEMTDRLIQTYGKTDWGHLDPSAYGPSIGPDRPRSEEVAGNLPPDSAKRVRDAMSCAACHSDLLKLDYLLAVRSDRDSKSFEGGRNMVQTFIEKGYMPPGNRLSQEERHALWTCLSKEYFDPQTKTGLLVDWLKGG